VSAAAPIRAALLAAALVLLAGCMTTGDERRSEAAASPEEAARINTDLGIGYLRQGRTDLALERLQRAVDQDRSYARAHASLAVVYQQLGESVDAERHFRTALRLTGRDPELQNTYGAFLCGEGRYREADEFFNRAADDRRYHTPAVALTNAGVCMRQQNDAARAEAYFRAALQRDPRFPDALLQLASLTLQGQNPFAARAFLERYFAVAPASAESLWLGVQLERTLGDERAARAYAGRLREDFADSPQAAELRESERDAG
jgi:type IV pilus assembly protein PilF